MRKLQLLLGLILALGAFVAVLFVGRLTQAPTYDVAVVLQEVPPYTPLTQDLVGIDTQSLSPAIADKYVQADDLEALLAEGAVVVEQLRPGQPLMREQVASGADAEGLTRLAVALDDPDRVILSVPVDEDGLPGIVPGDVVALFFATGQVRAATLTTYTVEGGEEIMASDAFGAPPVGEPYPSTGEPPSEEPYPVTGEPAYPPDGAWGLALEESGPVTVTTELEMPLAKWVANGVVYRLNRERRENPNYGAPGMEGEPRYIEGPVESLDVVVHRDDAEWVAFALAHGEVQVGVLPALTRPTVEAGTLAPEPGVTWSDFEERFFVERKEPR